MVCIAHCFEAQEALNEDFQKLADLLWSTVHEANPGETRMKRLTWMFIWWPGIDKDIEEKVKSCSECQSNPHGSLCQKVVTDNDPTFVSAEFKEFLHKNRIKHTTSAPYHPATMGWLNKR